MNLNDKTYHEADDASYQQQELIRRCQQGDQAAFQRIIQRYQDHVFTYISQTLPDQTQARTVTRQVFVAAYKAFPRFQEDVSLKAWIFSLAERYLLRAKRQQAPWYQRVLPQHLFSSTVSQPELSQDSDLHQTDCNVISDMLSPYLDGELSELESKRVEKHLQICPRCQQEFDELQETLNLVQSFGLIKAPPDLRVEITQEIEQIHSIPQKLLAWFPTPGLRAAAFAASLFVLFSGSLVVIQQEQIRRLHVQLQQQRIVRGTDTLSTSADDVITTFIIFTGNLVSQELPLATSELLAQIAPDPQKVQTHFLPGAMKTLGQQIETELQHMHGDIVEDHLVREENLLIRKIVVDVPATPEFLFSRALRQMNAEKTSQDASQKLRTTRLAIYLLDQQ